MVHLNAFEGRFVGEEQPVVEGVLGVDVMSQHDVGKLEGKHGRQRFFGWECIHQALAEDDGIAHRDRLKRGGQHHAAVHWRGELDVVADDDVVRHLLEDLVEVTGSGEQTGLRQTVEHVLLGLRDPLSLCLQWANVF